MTRKVAGDTARADLRDVAAALRVDAERTHSARRNGTHGRALLLAARVLETLADGGDPSQLINRNAQDSPRILDVLAVLDAVDAGAPNMTAACDGAAKARDRPAGTIRKNFSDYERERGVRYVLFGARRSRRKPDKSGRFD